MNYKKNTTKIDLEVQKHTSTISNIMFESEKELEKLRIEVYKQVREEIKTGKISSHEAAVAINAVRDLNVQNVTAQKIHDTRELLAKMSIGIGALTLLNSVAHNLYKDGFLHHSTTNVSNMPDTSNMQDTSSVSDFFDF